jgi:hypothetical protein
LWQEEPYSHQGSTTGQATKSGQLSLQVEGTPTQTFSQVAQQRNSDRLTEEPQKSTTKFNFIYLKQ